MKSIFVLSQSLLGAGMCSVLQQVADWQVEQIPTQDLEAIATLAQQARPAVTIVDATTGDPFALFDRLGNQRIRSMGMLVVVTAGARTEETLFRLMLWGVAAYLSVVIAPEEFIAMVEQVSTGVFLLSEACLDPDTKRDVPVTFLTAGETTVLLLVARGMFNKEIARTLGISEQTVKNHLTACFKKLGVRSRAAAVASASSRGWIELPAISSSIPQNFGSVA